jgi:hypothetical protein
MINHKTHLVAFENHAFQIIHLVQYIHTLLVMILYMINHSVYVVARIVVRWQDTTGIVLLVLIQSLLYGIIKNNPIIEVALLFVNY